MRRKIWDDVGTALLALVLALIVWVNATIEGDEPKEGIFPDPIPIHVLDAPSDLIDTNNPTEHIKVTIKTFTSIWEGLEAADFSAVADWRTLGEGMHAVPIEVTCSDPTVNLLSIHPSTVYVRLEPVKRELKEVTVDLQDRDQVPLGYRVYLPETEPDLVTIEGPASAVDRVARIAVSVSLLNKTDSVERLVEPVPVDEGGKPVEGVNLTPQTVTVKVAIEKKQNFREVAVRARTKGQPARGYFVSGVDIVPSTITIVGPPNVIDTMGGLVDVKGEIDVTGATRMLADKMALDLPGGVSVLEAKEGETFTILVTVWIDAVTGGTTVELHLEARKLQEGLVVKLSVPAVDVILRGPAVLLDELETAFLDAYVDLGGLGEGTHQVKPDVDIRVAQDSKLRDLVVSDISPKSIEVVISVPPTLTSTPTNTPTPTFTITPTPLITATATITGTVTITATGAAQGTITPTLGMEEGTIAPTLRPAEGTAQPEATQPPNP